MAPVDVSGHVCLPESAETTLVPSHHTPAPDWVRRTTHTPFFSSTDRRLTSFLRLPPEIRLEIYRLLLLYPASIEYKICAATSRLYYRTLNYTKDAYHRHGLFPAILSCCRVTRDEGAQVLYGENHFSIGACGHFLNNSWPLSTRCQETIARLDLGWYAPATLPSFLTLFPGARRLSFHCLVPVRDREAFLDWVTAEHVDALERVEMGVSFMLKDEEKGGSVDEGELGLELCRRIIKRGGWGRRRVNVELRIPPGYPVVASSIVVIID